MTHNGEMIDTLPTDNTTYTKSQLEIANLLFKENESTMDAVASEIKDALVISILFVIFSLNQIDELVHKIIPSSRSSYAILMGIKCICVVIIFYFVKNFQLSRK